jgi:Golgi SNAP receptor complex protein 2
VRQRCPLLPRAATYLAAQGNQSVAVDALLAERSSVTHSGMMVDELTALAGSVKGSLRDQRTVLKSAHKKVLDVASTLGLSNTVMRMIERRTMADKILVFGGMVVMLAFLGLLYAYFGR